MLPSNTADVIHIVFAPIREYSSFRKSYCWKLNNHAPQLTFWVQKFRKDKRQTEKIKLEVIITNRRRPLISLTESL